MKLFCFDWTERGSSIYLDSWEVRSDGGVRRGTDESQDQKWQKDFFLEFGSWLLMKVAVDGDVDGDDGSMIMMFMMWMTMMMVMMSVWDTIDQVKRGGGRN